MLERWAAKPPPHPAQPRARVEEGEVLLGEVAGGGVGGEAGCVFPVGAGAGEVAAALADDAALEEGVGVFGIEIEGRIDVGLGLVQLVEVTAGGGAQDEGVGALWVKVEGVGEVGVGFGIKLQGDGGDGVADQEIGIIRREF